MAESLSPLKAQVAEIAIELWLEDAALAGALARAQWFRDGITTSDLDTVRGFVGLASRNRAVARQVAASAWFVDSLSDGGRRLIHLLGPDRSSPAFLTDEPGHAGVLTGDLADFFLATQGFFRGDARREILDQAWFADGLSPLEMAFAVGLSGVAVDNPPLYRDLLRERYAATRRASLPLAGEVSFYVFQNSPISDSTDILDRMERTARVLEEFLGVPFPTTEIILLIGDATVVDYPVNGGGHVGSHMVLTRRAHSGVPHIAHEVAHYYFRDGPQWFVEGGATLVERIVDDEVDVSVYAPREDAPPSAPESCLGMYNAQNIRHFLLMNREDEYLRVVDGCVATLGEWLFVHLYDAVGEEALGLALRSWYLSQDRPLERPAVTRPGGVNPAEGPIREQRVFDSLWEGVPEDARERFRRVYLEKHGGTGGGPDDGIPDDIGDGIESASAIEPGDTIAGSLDHSFDFDYFRFSAKVGQKYAIDFHHRTATSRLAIYRVPASYVYDGSHWYESAGEVHRRVTPASRELDRNRPWVAPSSGDFYVAVQNFGGAAGPYTFSLRPLEDGPDDHADTPALATDLAIGVVAAGTLNNVRDFDYFRFRPSDGQRYRISVVTSEEHWFYLSLYDSEGNRAHGTSLCGYPYAGANSYGWNVSEADDFYIVINGDQDARVSYTISVTKDDD